MVSQVKSINYIPDFLKNPSKRFALSNDAFSSPVSGQMRYDNSINVLKWFNGTSEVSHLDTRLNQFLSPNATVSFNSQNLSDLATPLLPNDATTKGYVDALTITSRSWKELILIPEQLSSSNDCILQAIAFYLAGNVVITDTFIITDGTTTNTFAFVTSRSTAFEVTRGATANDSLTNLVSAIATDSTLWTAILKTNLNSINATDGYVSVIYRRNQTVTSYTDRLYGTFTTQSNSKQVNFNSQSDYLSSTITSLLTTDPAVKTFGIGKATADLIANETHAIRSSDTVFTWDNDSNAWQGTSGSSYTASTPINLLANNFSLNIDKGLEINGVNLEVRVNTNGALIKNTGAGTNELSVVPDDSTIEINSNALRVKDSGITANKLSTDSVTTVKILALNVTGAKIANNTIDETKLTTSIAGNGLVGGNGTALSVGSGIGITANADDVQINKALVPTYYSFTITGDGSTTTFPLTHNAGTNKYNVTIINNTSGDNEEVSWGRNSGDPTNKVDVVFSPAPINALAYTAIVTVFG
jgi:hypothetical protein